MALRPSAPFARESDQVGVETMTTGSGCPNSPNVIAALTSHPELERNLATRKKFVPAEVGQRKILEGATGNSLRQGAK